MHEYLATRNHLGACRWLGQEPQCHFAQRARPLQREPDNASKRPPASHVPPSCQALVALRAREVQSTLICRFEPPCGSRHPTKVVRQPLWVLVVVAMSMQVTPWRDEGWSK